MSDQIDSKNSDKTDKKSRKPKTFSNFFNQFKSLDKRMTRNFLIMGVVLLVLTGILGAYYGTDFSQKNDIFQENDLVIQNHNIPTYDDKKISALIIMDENSASMDNSTIPVIIIVHGVNENKEAHLEKGINLAKHGFISIIIDQRGHGSTNAPSSFAYYEINDISAIIDWTDTNLKMANASNVGLIGASLGGMVSLIAQTQEERIKATVTLSAPSNMTKIIEIVNVDEIFASSTQISITQNSLDIRSPVYHIDPENTDNLLIIQSFDDILVDMGQAEELYEKVDGENNSDIQIIKRDGLTHGSNIMDRNNLKMTILWFQYYLLNETVDIANINTSSEAISLISYERVSKTPYVVLLLLISIIIFSLLGYYFNQIKPGMKENSKKNSFMMKSLRQVEASCPLKTKKEEKTVFSLLIGAFFGSYIIAGMLSVLLDLSVFEAYLILPGIIGIPMILLVIYYMKAFYCGAWNMINIKMDMGVHDLSKNLIINLLPIFVYIGSAELIFSNLLITGYNILNQTFLYYVLTFTLSIYFDLFFIKTLTNVSGTKTAEFFSKYESTSLILLKTLLAFFIYIIFPIKNVLNYRVSLNLIFILFGSFGTLGFIGFIKFYQKLNKNLTSAILLNSIILATLLSRYMVRVY